MMQCVAQICKEVKENEEDGVIVLAKMKTHVPQLKPLAKNKLFAIRNDDFTNVDISQLETERSVSAVEEAM